GGALETAGGIATARSWLAPGGDESFWVVSGDVFVPRFPYDDVERERFDASDDLGRIWLVPNPEWHAGGDFALEGDRATRATPRAWTYANVALLKPGIVDGITRGTRAALGPRLFQAADHGRLAGAAWQGEWHNVGNATQLAAAENR